MKTLVHKKRHKDFGLLSKEYNTGRTAFPRQSIDACLSKTKSKHPIILDLGCGTGIATRQLAKSAALVIGCDMSRAMLGEAMDNPAHNVAYIMGNAEKIPFADDTFDLLTAFSSFHWFANARAIREIRRVLKPKQYFCVIHKYEMSKFASDFRSIVSASLKAKVPSSLKGEYDLKQLLGKNGFTAIVQKDFIVTERLTLDRYITFLKSTSTWNFVPQNQKKAVENKLYKHFKELFPNNIVTRNLKIQVTTAKS